MKTIGFIGGSEKINLILYIAKILTEMGERILIVDTTQEQRAKYVVPSISTSPSYVTNYEEIDVAVGLYTFNEVSEYLGYNDFNATGYTYLLVDLDNNEAIEKFNIYSSFKNYFVTTFDLYALKRGINVLSGIREPLNLTKILFSKDMTAEEDEYLNFLSLGKKVIWDEERIYFPFDNGDNSIIAENQRLERMKLRGLSQEYKEALAYVIEQITDGEKGNSNVVKKIIRQLEKV